MPPSCRLQMGAAAFQTLLPLPPQAACSQSSFTLVPGKAGPLLAKRISDTGYRIPGLQAAFDRATATRPALWGCGCRNALDLRPQEGQSSVTSLVHGWGGQCHEWEGSCLPRATLPDDRTQVREHATCLAPGSGCPGQEGHPVQPLPPQELPVEGEFRHRCPPSETTDGVARQ